MPFLEPIRNKLRILGMSSTQSLEKYSFNARNLTSLLIYGINSSCNIGFLMFGAKNLMEFTDSLYLTVTAILAVSILINLIWQMRQLFVFLDKLEITVEQSKFYCHSTD